MTPSQEARDPWQDLFWQLALELDCLPSTFLDGNAHVFRKAVEMKAAACTYPRCNCPFDAPADPNWCARGLRSYVDADRKARQQDALTDEQITSLVTALFPRWREDIQERFVLEVARAVLAKGGHR